jgi:hypothetical protein
MDSAYGGCRYDGEAKVYGPTPQVRGISYPQRGDIPLEWPVLIAICSARVWMGSFNDRSQLALQMVAVVGVGDAGVGSAAIAPAHDDDVVAALTAVPSQHCGRVDIRLLSSITHTEFMASSMSWLRASMAKVGRRCRRYGQIQ